MDELIREKATSKWDTPHDYTHSGETAGVCYCGRRESNTLHLPQHLTEHASASTRIQTEKGTI